MDLAEHGQLGLQLCVLGLLASCLLPELVELELQTHKFRRLLGHAKLEALHAALQRAHALVIQGLLPVRGDLCILLAHL